MLHTIYVDILVWGLNTSLLNFTIGFCVRIDTFHYGLMGELRKKKGELEKVPMTGS